MTDTGGMESAAGDMMPPSYLVLRTEGMDPERYAALRAALADLGVQAATAAYRRPVVDTIANPSTPESPVAEYVTERAVLNFAESRLYQSGMGERVWGALHKAGHLYATPEEAAQAPPYQSFNPLDTGARTSAAALIRFTRHWSPDQSHIEGDALDLAAAEVLMRSLLSEDYGRLKAALIRNFGGRGQSLLADYINHRRRPHEPLPVAFEPDGSIFDPVKAPLPERETFAPDPESPYLTRAALPQDTPLVTDRSLSDYGAAISLNMHNKRVNFSQLMQQVASLGREIAEVSDISPPRLVYADVYLLRNWSEPRYRGVPNWAMTPQLFLETVHMLESDETLREGVPAYRPGLRAFIRRYLNVIRQLP